MADIDYDLLAEKLAAAITAANERGTSDRRREETERQSAEASKRSTREALEFAKTIKEAGTASSSFKRILQGQKAEYLSAERLLDKLNKEIEEDTEALKELGEAADSSTRVSKQFELQQKLTTKAQKEAEISTANLKVAFANASLGIARFSEQALTTGIQAGTQYAKTLARGGTSIEAASGLLTTGVDIAASGAKTVAGGMQEAGTAALMFGKGKGLKLAGAGLLALGKAADLATTAMTELAKSGIELLSAEIQKSIDTYNSAASAGAIFATGVTELRDAAHNAGMSVVTMSNIIKNNADSMYYSGMNMGVATKKISSAFSVGGDSFKQSLFNLGYSLEEQGGLIADTMKYLSVAGRDIRTMTGGDVATATKEYAVNLKTIAAITGDDAKKRLEQAREASSNAAIQAKLAQMDPKARQQFMDDIALVPEGLRRAVLQQRVLGTVVDKSSNILMAMAPEMYQAVQGFSSGLGQGSSVMGQLKEQLAYSIEGINKTGNLAAIGVADLAGIGGAGADASKLFSTILLDLQKGAKNLGDTKIISESITAMMNTVEPTQKAMSSLQIQSGVLAKEVENIAGTYLPRFGRVLEQVNQQMIAMIKAGGEAIGATAGNNNKPGIADKLMGSLSKANTAGMTLMPAGAATGAVIGGIPGIAAGPAGIVAGATAGSATGAALGYLTGAVSSLGVDIGSSIIDWFKGNTARHALGGKAITGKVNIFGEQGPEAAVPLPDGRSIPVTIKMLGDAVKTENADATLVDNFIDLSRALSLVVSDVQSVVAGFKTSVSDSLNLIGNTNQSFVNSLSQASNFSDNLIKALADKSTATRPNAYEMMQFKDRSVTQNITEYLQPQLDSLALSKNIVVDLRQDLDSKISELKADVKRSMEDTKTTVVAQEEKVQKPSIDLAELVNQMKISNSDLKETIQMQSRLLEQNVRTSEQLLSVANDTRTYSQSIAQNTL